VSPVRYELGFYIPEDGILQAKHCPSVGITWAVSDNFIQAFQEIK
jgi:hypothetical protein